jgi:hypothetical protein
MATYLIRSCKSTFRPSDLRLLPHGRIAIQGWRVVERTCQCYCHRHRGLQHLAKEMQRSLGLRERRGRVRGWRECAFWSHRGVIGAGKIINIASLQCLALDMRRDRVIYWGCSAMLWSSRCGRVAEIGLEGCVVVLFGGLVVHVV